MGFEVEPYSVHHWERSTKLTDRNPDHVPVQGGYITWKPKGIVFTSNQPWNCCSPRSDTSIMTLSFQVTQVYEDRTEIEFQS